MLLDTVITGDALDVLPTLPTESVNLVVTSPPYPKQRDCRMDVPEWLSWQHDVLTELTRVLTPTGVLVLNVMFPRNGGAFDHRLFIGVLGRLHHTLGLHLVDVYMWHKSNPVPCGNLDRHDIPAWEPVFVAARGADYPFYPVRDEYAPKTVGKALNGNMRRAGVAGHYAGGHSDLHPDGARQTNVLTVSSSGDQGRPRAEGGSFPLALPERFIRQHTRPGDVVADPFCGVGTTLKAAQQLGRHYVGIELKEHEAQTAREWLAEPHMTPLFAKEMA